MEINIAQGCQTFFWVKILYLRKVKKKNHVLVMYS